MNTHVNIADEDNPAADIRVDAIIDGMAFVNGLEKPDWVKTCADLAVHFNKTFIDIYGQYEEIHLVFDHYDLPMSLKTATHDRQLGKQPVVHTRSQTHTKKCQYNNGKAARTF